MNENDIPNPSEPSNASTGGADDPAANPTIGETAPLNPNDALAQVQKERDDFFEQLQRTRAEFANYQKRAKTQADADRIYAVGTLARDLLDPLDNLERATEALRASAVASVGEGVAMVHRQLLEMLAKHGVEPIAALGQPFDPNQHEAIVQQPDAERPEGTVVAELSRGYKIRDRVLRPTKVAVSVKPKAE